MPQTKQSFLKGRTTQFLLERLRCNGLSWPNYGNGKQPTPCYQKQITEWKINKWQEVIRIRDNSQHPVVYWEYTLGEIKDELDLRPHISHKRERKQPHKFPFNKRKQKT